MNAVNKILIFFLLLLSSCSSSEKVNEILDVNRIDQKVNKYFHNLGSLKEAALIFYIALINGDWEVAYEFRSNDFKRNIPMGAFVKTIEEVMVNYRIVDLDFIRIDNKINADGEVYESTLILKTIQKPHLNENITAIKWFKEDGNWRVDSIGLVGSPLLGRW